MNEKLMRDILSEKQEVPEELKKRIHDELIRQEKAIMIRNITLSLATVFLFTFSLFTFAFLFLGDYLSLIFAFAFSVFCVIAATALAVAAGKYEMKLIKKGLC